MTLRFETATMVGQRWLLQYLVPWLKNVELVDISEEQDESHPNSQQDEKPREIPENTRQLKPVTLQGEGT